MFLVWNLSKLPSIPFPWFFSWESKMWLRKDLWGRDVLIWVDLKFSLCTACVHACGCTCVVMCVAARVSILIMLYLLFRGRIYHWAPSQWIQRGWLDSRSRAPPISSSPALGCTHAPSHTAHSVVLGLNSGPHADMAHASNRALSPALSKSLIVWDFACVRTEG